jgi:hypothetical protein
MLTYVTEKVKVRIIGLEQHHHDMITHQHITTQIWRSYHPFAFKHSFIHSLLPVSGARYKLHFQFLSIHACLPKPAERKKEKTKLWYDIVSVSPQNAAVKTKYHAVSRHQHLVSISIWIRDSWS